MNNLDRVVTVMNGKGGVGKTSLVGNVGALLAAMGHRILVADLDPQALRIRSNDGWLPLHVAALHSGSLDVIFHLVTVSQEAFRVAFDAETPRPSSSQPL